MRVRQRIHRPHGGTKNIRAGRTIVAIALAAGIVFLGGVDQSWGSRDDNEMRSLLRQISLMTKVFDAMLVESPHVLVAGKNVAHGLYLDGYGVVLGASVSLDLPDDWSAIPGLGSISGLRITEDDEGRRVIILDEESDDEDTEVISEVTEERKHRRRWRGVREEITQLLADYGPTLRNLEDDEKVGVALFRWDMMAGEEGPRTLLLEVTRGDLKGFASGQISEEQLRERIRVTEY